MVLDALRTAKPVPDPRSDGFAAELSALLQARGVLDELGARRARRAQKQSNERFDVVLTRLGLVSDAAMTQALCEILGMPVMTAADFPVAPLAPGGLKLAFLKQSRIAIVSDEGDRVVAAVSDPFNADAIASLAFKLELPVVIRLATAADIDAHLAGDSGGAGSGSGLDGATVSDDCSSDDVRRLEDMASEAPVIKLVHDIILRAVEQKASDIHIEPREDSVRVRFRIDGVLQTVDTLPLTVKAALASRIKIMARLNIAERRLPQDGRIKNTVRGREIDLRVSTMPTLCGESVVLRILDRSTVALDFAALGIGGQELDTFKTLLQEPNGILLVTGPTGSGKTTTLYTALGTLNTSGRKLFTVEDPIEYQLPGINQIHVAPKIGLTFASALRSILRQDPDIIMVGEIRDLETAEIAIRASLTGHLVLSTVHTNSAAATITRLLDMGVEDYLLASSLKGILAQRLVRRLCPSCAVPANFSPAYAQRLIDLAGPELSAEAAARASPMTACGCKSCRNTGFSGRTTIYELMPVDGGLRDAILSRDGEQALTNKASASGMVTMLQSGVIKVLNGETAIEEVLRVTRAADATLHV